MTDHADVVLCVPFFFCSDADRADVTRRVFASLKGLTVIGVGSEGDLSRELFCEHHPADRYREYEQTWRVPNGAGSAGLRDKYDYAIQQAQAYEPRTVFLVGSDDFMLDAQLRPTVDYYQPSSADLVVAAGGTHVWEYDTARCRYYDHPCPNDLQHTGGALGFSAEYLDRVGWKPFQNPSCEQGAERLVRDTGGTIEARPNSCLTVRCHKVLNSSGAMRRRWKGKAESSEPFERWWDALAPDKPSTVTVRRDLKVSVLIPFAGECEWRRRALAWVQQEYEDIGWEVVIGHGDADRWCKAEAVADAFARSDGDLLVVADADVWADDIEEAVYTVEDGAAWAVPFTQVQRIDRRSTEDVLAGAPFSAKLHRARPPYRGVVGGGCVVLPRQLYERVPLDRRFVGWGREDESWGRALRALAGQPERLTGRLWHLWHPPAAESGKYRNEVSEKLAERYRAAAKLPDRMRTIVDEGVAWISNASSSHR